MNRRELLPALGTGAAFGVLATLVGTTHGCAMPSHAAEAVSSELAAAIEAHRATIRHDETLYNDNCEPTVDKATLDASDVAIGTAFLAMMAVPCQTPTDAAAKAKHVLAGSVGLRTHGWGDEFLHLLTGGENGETHDPKGPLVALLRSLAGEGTCIMQVPSEPDPLLALISAYRREMAAFNASGDLTDAENEALSAATWHPHYRTLCERAPAATTLAGATAAVRLAVEDMEGCEDTELVGGLLRAALAYFDGKA